MSWGNTCSTLNSVLGYVRRVHDGMCRRKQQEMRRVRVFVQASAWSTRHHGMVGCTASDQTRNRRTVLPFLLSLSMFGAVSCGTAEGTSASQQTAAPPIRVSLAVVEGRDEPVTIEATGAFQADEASDVAPEASGRVVRTPVDIGQFVRAGSTSGDAAGR